MESGDKREVFIDTNFFMIPFQFNVDILEEFKRILPNYQLVTTKFVINELKGLKKNSKGKVRLAAGLGLKIAQSGEIECIGDKRCKSKKESKEKRNCIGYS